VRFIDETPIRFGFQVFEQTFSSSNTETVPASTTGQATGGGQVAPDATFGFNAKSDSSGMKGTCTVIDRAAIVTVKCLDVRSFLRVGTHVTFSGNARVNGTPTTYRVDVDDVAEDGAGSDAFAIATGSGYAAGGPLTQGNIQVH
jgi:hypothetical protein